MRTINIGCLVLAAFGLSGQVNGANFTWDGAGGMGNSKWSNGNNWGIPDAANTAPPISGLTTSDIFFGGTVKLTPQVDENYSFRTLTFNSGAGAFTMTPQSAEILTVGTGGIINNSLNLQTFSSQVTLGTSQSWNANAGALKFDGRVNLGANTLTFSGSKTTTITGGIIGSGSFLKTGSGEVIITSSNSFSGTSTINGGTVRANNSTGSATGNGNVVIGNNGRLTGNGKINGSVTINQGGTIAAGNSPGTLSTGSQIWNGGGIDIVEIKDVDSGEGVGWDFLNITGTLTINSTLANSFYLDVTSLNLSDLIGSVADFDNTETYSWRIASATGGIIGFDESYFQIVTTNFVNDLGVGEFGLELANGNKDLVLTYVPEPSVFALAGVGALMFCALIRRKKTAA